MTEGVTFDCLAFSVTSEAKSPAERQGVGRWGGRMPGTITAWLVLGNWKG